MTPEAIRSSLEALAKSAAVLRRRPAREIVEALARVLDAWRDPGTRWRRELEKRLPEATGFSTEMVRAALAHSLDPLSGDALLDLVGKELGGSDALDGAGATLPVGFETTSVLLAGSLPTPTLLTLLAPLVLRSGVLTKPSAHDPVTAGLVAASVAAVDPELGDCLRLAGFPGSDAPRMAAFLEADCIVATGSDPTLAAVAEKVQPPRRLVRYGHRVSMAVAGPDISGAAIEPWAAAIGKDVALWDQLGCLSPLAVFSTGADGDRIAEALAEALGAAERRWPRGRLSPQAAADIAGQREDAEFRAAAGSNVRVLTSTSTLWTVVREGDARLRPAPLHRFLRVHPLEGVGPMLDALRPLGPHLAGVALAGFGSDTEAIARSLAELGATRVCSPGRLQAPPLGWRRGQPGVLLPHARFQELGISGP